MCHRLNLLIAIMGDSYEKVKESEHVEAVRERARIIMEAERRFPTSHHYHRFMHFVEPVDSATVKETMWEGATKRVNQMMRAEIDRLDDELVQMKSDLNSELVQMKRELNRKLDMLLERSQM